MYCIGPDFNIDFLKIFTLDYAGLHKWRFEHRDDGFNNNVINCSLFSARYISEGDSECELWEKLQTQLLASKEQATSKADSLGIVFVLGESFIRSHSQLYGYKLSTTPKQLKEYNDGNIAVFKDISTVAKFTDIVVSNVFCLNSISLDEDWFSKAFFPIIMKKAGWDVYHYDNNVVGASFFNKLAGNIFRSKAISDICFTDVYIPQSEELDHIIIRKAIERPRREDTKNKFTIIHLFGQHVQFKSCVPEGFARFSIDDYVDRTEPWMNNERRQLIADYDNATLANDSVMGMIYDHWRDKNAVVVYVSDHGEEVYDYHDSMGRKNRTDQTMEQYVESFFMVPATVWMSDRFMSLHPEKAKAIRKSTEKRGTIDDIGHFILGMAEVQSPYYKPERDIASDRYQSVRRLTAEGFFIDSL